MPLRFLDTLLADNARVRRVVFGALLALTCLVSLGDFYSFQFGYQPDAVEYTLLARSLLEGPSFGLVHTPGVPEPTHYPFGYPLLLTPFVLLAPRDFALPQWLSLAATLVSGAILFWGWRALVPNYGAGWRYAVTAMFMLAPMTIVHTRLAISEPAFMVFVLLALYFAARLLGAPQNMVLWVGLSIALVLMVSIRSIGLVILASILVYLVFALRRQLVRGLVVLAATFALVYAAVLMLTPVQPENLIPSQYLDWFVGVASRNPEQDRRTPIVLTRPEQETDGAAPGILPFGISFNTTAQAVHIHKDIRTMLTLTGGGALEQVLAARLNAEWLLSVPGFLVLGLVILGNVRWARDTRRAPGPYVSLFQFASFGYLGIALIWIGGGDRLFYPVQPQLYLATLLAVGALLRAGVNGVRRLGLELTPARANTLVRLGLGALVAAWLLLAVYRNLTLPSSYETWGDLRQRTDPIQAHTPPEAILLSDWPAFDYLITGRRTVEFPPGRPTVAEFRTLLRNEKVDYVILAYNPNDPARGIAAYNLRVEGARSVLAELRAQGELVPVYSDAFPLSILRVAP